MQQGTNDVVLEVHERIQKLEKLIRIECKKFALFVVDECHYLAKDETRKSYLKQIQKNLLIDEPDTHLIQLNEAYVSALLHELRLNKKDDDANLQIINAEMHLGKLSSHIYQRDFLFETEGKIQASPDHHTLEKKELEALEKKYSAVKTVRSTNTKKILKMLSASAV